MPAVTYSFKPNPTLVTVITANGSYTVPAGSFGFVAGGTSGGSGCNINGSAWIQGLASVNSANTLWVPTGTVIATGASANAAISIFNI